MKQAETGPYGRLALWVLERSRGVGAAALLLTLFALFLGLPPKIDSNLLNLLPESIPSVAAINRINEEEGGLNLLTLSFAGEDPQVLDEVLDDLTAQFDALDSVRFAVHDLDPNLMTHVGLLQLEAREVDELNNRLRGALALGPVMNPLIAQRLMELGPLTERISKLSAGPEFFQSNEGRGKVILRPDGSAHDQVFSKALMDEVYRILDEADVESKGLELVWLGGSYRHTVEDVEGIRSDLARTSFSSAALVLGCIVVFFRSFRSIFVVFPPLVLANAVNLAVVQMMLGALNTYTSFGTAILLGLGIDFAVHLVGRFREQRAAGVAFEPAVARAWDQTGPPCTTAALTSAAGFLALAAAEFRGFSQLGFLLAVGLITSLLAMLVLLPILLRWMEPDYDRPLLGTGDVQNLPESRATYQLAPVGLMLAVLLTGVVGASSIPQLEFEFDTSALRRDGLSYAELSEEERALARESYSPVVADFESRKELVDEQRRLQAMAQRGEFDHIAGTASIVNVLPEDQLLRNASLRDLVTLTEHKNLKYLPPVIAKQLVGLRGTKIEELTLETLPEAVPVLLGMGKDDVHRLVMIPKGNLWDMREAEALSDEVYDALPDTELAGEFLGVAGMFKLVQKDGPIVSFFALVMVVLLAFIDLKRPLYVAGAVGTLLAGLLWAASMLPIAGVKLSMINVVALPILLGIGVDVVIHLLHRLREEGPGGVRRALLTTGVAATVSTLTTVASFASLMLAGNRGVRGLGELVCIGLTTIFIVSAALLPLIWSAGWKVAGLAPAENTPPE